MGLYLYIAYIDLEQNPRVIYIYTYVMNEMHNVHSV